MGSFLMAVNYYIPRRYKTMEKKTLKVGGVAPAFTLLNQKGKKISLKDYKGKKTSFYIFTQRQ